MDASQSKGLLYNILSEETFANHRLDMTDVNDDYTISDHVSQHFGITIGEKRYVLIVMPQNPPTYLTTSHLFYHGKKCHRKGENEINQS